VMACFRISLFVCWCHASRHIEDISFNTLVATLHALAASILIFCTFLHQVPNAVEKLWL